MYQKKKKTIIDVSHKASIKTKNDFNWKKPRTLQVNVSSNSNLSVEGYLTGTVGGVLLPSDRNWVAMISPSYSKCKVHH